jgi:hypothetical protein
MCGAERLTTEVMNTAAHFGAGAALGHHTHGADIEISLLNLLIAAIAGANNRTTLSDDTAGSSRKVMGRALEYVRRHE